jgi:hypothetical protein
LLLPVNGGVGGGGGKEERGGVEPFPSWHQCSLCDACAFSRKHILLLIFPIVSIATIVKTKSTLSVK